MEQLPLFEQPCWSVSDLTHYLRMVLESDERLQDIWVQGEVSNLSRPASGHLYFTLKDANASLRCVMWKPSVSRLVHLPQEGDAVEAHGNLSIYEKGGQYQLSTDWIRPAGEGFLYQEFLRLKERLEAEGLFDPERKRPIPPQPKRIGVVTSPTGAALQDILNTIARRYPLVEVILAPAQVQGESAPGQIVAAIAALNRAYGPDVIIVARGGGSIEDLWAFNDENVARAIVSSKAPVITGIGHQTDFTIADFAADLRAPTPTAAAEMATPDRIDLLAAVNDLYSKLFTWTTNNIVNQRWLLSQKYNQLLRVSPYHNITTQQQYLDETIGRLERALTHQLQLQKLQFDSLHRRLLALNPDQILQKGFAVLTQKSTGDLVSSINQVKSGDILGVQVSDGKFDTIVK